MPKIKVNSHYDPVTGRYAAVVLPEAGSRVPPYTSDPVYETHDAAVLAGVRHLEISGVRNVNWHAVIELLG